MSTEIAAIEFKKELIGKHKAGPIWLPMHITAKNPILKDVILHGRTWGRDGCIVTIIDRNLGEMDRVDYYRDFLTIGITRRFVEKVTTKVNILLELQGHPADSIEEYALGKILDALFSKCESRYGKIIIGSEYEVKVAFE
jgi:hypothetical protein